jgi:hypothetical protein
VMKLELRKQGLVLYFILFSSNHALPCPMYQEHTNIIQQTSKYTV